MKTTFIVTSAIHTRFGVYDYNQRLAQTLDTIKCLRDRVPDCKIVINEVSGSGYTPETENALMDAVDVFLDFTKNSDVQYIYSTPQFYNNWDIVKNLTELTTFPQSLKTLWDAGEIQDQDRIFKMSGRYLLNEKFDLSMYEQDEIKDKVVIGKSVPSQFPYAVVGMSMQYMCRLLSWPVARHLDMIKYYDIGRNYMINRMAMGGYADIEHCLYHGIPREIVHELDEVGVYGNIAPNGAPIVN
jgi:hypothetical protein